MNSQEVINRMRPNIRSLEPYSTARDEYKGIGGIFLDANENPFGSPLPGVLNRYPDPGHKALKNVLSEMLQLPEEMLFTGCGSDEAIDVLYKVFCTPGQSRVLIQPPTYGMYEVLANVYDLDVIKVPLNGNFEPDVPALLQYNNRAEMLFFCSPNNPTGNLMNREKVREILRQFNGIVIIDEAYMDFAEGEAWAGEVQRHPNLVVLKTLSKLWGLAGLRIGIAIAHAEVIKAMNKVKLPYNLSKPVMDLAVKALKNREYAGSIKVTIRENRSLLMAELSQLKRVVHIFPSEANFLLVRFDDAETVFRHLTERHIIVRNRSREVNCQNCLRITVGTEKEIHQLITALKEIDNINS